jgi:GT2 family glycosyltransferase
VELCARILRAGRSLWVVPEAKVLHLDPPPAPKGAIHPFAFHKHKNLLAFYLLHAPSSVLPSFYARHGPLALARALMSDRRVASIQLRGWAWFLRHLPGLLRDRRKITRETEQPLT